MDVAWFAPLALFVIAFVSSMSGIGGSQLYIPILFRAGTHLGTEAVPLGMLLEVVNDASAAATYGARRMMAWRMALLFAQRWLPLPRSAPG